MRMIRRGATRRVWRTGLVIAALVVMAGCGKVGTQSPKEQNDRERKAAGLSTFHIVCIQDLWDRTGGKYGRGAEYQKDPIPAKITKREDGLITVELTGPKLVDLLRYLDGKAHPGDWSDDPDPLAVRMYEGIAPRIDAIKAVPKAGDPPPEVTIDDSVGASTPSPTATPSAASPQD